MNDGQRRYPVDYFFLHHSTGPDFVNAEDIQVQDWYSDTGKARAYSGGAINPMHEHPSRPGQLTYAQAHFTLREYSKDGNKYGWRLTDLIARPWQNVAWAVGNWDYNVMSSSVEICGNYLNKNLPDKALMCLADFLRDIDNELGGALKVWLHKEVYATACPARISDQRNTLIDMINNPDKWNNILWPPQPVITIKEETVSEIVPFEKVNVEDSTVPKDETKITQVGVQGNRTVVYVVTYTNGIETSRSVKSDTVSPQPITEITAIGTYVAPDKPLEPTPGEDAKSWIQRVIEVIIEWLSKFTYKP